MTTICLKDNGFKPGTIGQDLFYHFLDPLDYSEEMVDCFLSEDMSRKERDARLEELKNICPVTNLLDSYRNN